MQENDQLVPIPFASMEYLFLFEGVLTWEYSGEYSFTKENDKMGLEELRQGIYSEKGFITVDSIDNVLLSHDSNNGFFVVHVFFNGHSIPFNTKKESEAESLYDMLFVARFGFKIGMGITKEVALD